MNKPTGLKIRRYGPRPGPGKPPELAALDSNRSFGHRFLTINVVIFCHRSFGNVEEREESGKSKMKRDV